MIELIFKRRSIRKYLSKTVEDDLIKKILEAGMAAPSSNNAKPWHFIVITNRTTLDKLAAMHPYGKMLYDAPLAIAICGDPATSARAWMVDCAAATENILLGITALGLGGVWLGIYNNATRENGMREILGIPPEIGPFSLVSIGYPAEEKQARTQYEQDRVHREKW